MPTLKVTHEELRLLNDMFSAIADLGLFDAYEENEQDSCPDLFDKLWDKVIAAKCSLSFFFTSIHRYYHEKYTFEPP